MRQEVTPDTVPGVAHPYAPLSKRTVLVDLANAVIADAVSYRLQAYGYASYSAEPVPREPDIIIVDSTSAANKTAERYPEARVLLMETAARSSDLRSAMLFHAVQGIISRTTNPREFAQALEAIAEGRVWIENSSLRDFLADAGLMSPRGQFVSFTPQEKTIVDAVCRGKTNKEIAGELHVSAHTVKSHIRNIIAKAGAVNRSHLASLFSGQTPKPWPITTDIPPERGSGTEEHAMAHERILIVEDEKITSMDIRQMLVDFGYRPLGPVASGDDAVASALSLRPDVVLMDIILKGSMNGIQAAEAIRAQSRCPVIFVTGNSDKLTVDSANATQPFGLVLKPIDEHELHAAIEKALHRPEGAPLSRASTLLN